MKNTRLIFVCLLTGLAFLLSCSSNNNKEYEKAISETSKWEDLTPGAPVIKLDLNNDNVAEEFIIVDQNDAGSIYQLFTNDNGNWKILCKSVVITGFEPVLREVSSDGWSDFGVMVPDGGYPVYIYSWNGSEYFLSETDLSGNEEGMYDDSEEQLTDADGFDYLGEEAPIFSLINGIWKDQNTGGSVVISIGILDEENRLMDFEGSTWIEKNGAKEVESTFALSDKCGEIYGATAYDNPKIITVFGKKSNTCYSYKVYGKETQLKWILTNNDTNEERILTRDTKDE